MHRTVNKWGYTFCVNITQTPLFRQIVQFCMGFPGTKNGWSFCVKLDLTSRERCTEECNGDSEKKLNFFKNRG